MEGIHKGDLRKVCTEPIYRVHHHKQIRSGMRTIPSGKPTRRSSGRNRAIANTTGIRVLAATTKAVPMRLMKRDLLFVVERFASLLDENCLAVVAKQHSIKKADDSDFIGKLFAAYLRRAEESALGGLLVEITILHAATRQNTVQVVRDAATTYKVDTEAITLKPGKKL